MLNFPASRFVLDAKSDTSALLEAGIDAGTLLASGLIVRTIARPFICFDTHAAYFS